VSTVFLLVSLLCGCHSSSETDSLPESDPEPGDQLVENSAAPKARDLPVSGPGAEKPSRNHPVKKHQTNIRFEPLSPDVFPEVIPRNGAEHEYTTLLESLGSGGAAVDIDLDSRPDLLIAGGGDFQGRSFVGLPIYCLRNSGSAFTNETLNTGLSTTEWYHHGIAAADFDGDGFSDLLITGYGGLQLFRNLGDGTFEEISRSSQLVCSDWSTSAGWGDFNRDGHLDLYVATYVNWSFDNDPPCYAADGVRRDNCSPKLFDALPDRLFLSLGDGTFSDASASFGVRPDGKALGVVTADIDLDGYLDVYVGNDVMINTLYHNESGQRFSDHSVSSGAGVSSRGSPDASMGVDVVDYNLDGLPDIWAANFEMESFAIYQNQGNMLFRHMSEATGISAIGEQYVGWGSIFADFELDGDEDLCVCNGNVVRYPQHSPALQRMLVMENVEGSFFEEVTEQVGESLMVPRNGRGLASMDWNSDGLPDLLATPTNSPAILYTNCSERSGHSITLTLIGRQSPRHPIGTTVRFRTSKGDRIRQLKGGSSYASTSMPTLHFGYPYNDSISEVHIVWPSGVEQVLPAPPLNSHLTILETASDGKDVQHRVTPATR
jgi:hypothetical protein